MKTVLLLFWEFFKVGLFSVGGGLATLPFLYDIAARRPWFTNADILDMIAISESTPGPLGINMATYVGYKTLGAAGGLVSVAGIITPAIVVIVIVSKILKRFRESEAVQRIFYGLRPASTGLIAAAGLGVAKVTLLRVDAFRQTGSILQLFNWKLIVLAVVLYFAMKKWDKHPILFIAAAAAAGIVLKL